MRSGGYYQFYRKPLNISYLMFGLTQPGSDVLIIFTWPIIERTEVSSDSVGLCFYQLTSSYLALH